MDYLVCVVILLSLNENRKYIDISWKAKKLFFYEKKKKDTESGMPICERH